MWRGSTSGAQLQGSACLSPYLLRGSYSATLRAASGRGAGAPRYRRCNSAAQNCGTPLVHKFTGELIGCLRATPAKSILVFMKKPLPDRAANASADHWLTQRGFTLVELLNTLMADLHMERKEPGDNFDGRLLR